MPSAAVCGSMPGDGEGDDRGEGVGDVERAGQRRPWRVIRSPLGPTAVNVESVRADLDVLGAPVGVRVALGGEGDDRDGRPP